MSPFSKEARSHRLALDRGEPILSRAGGLANPQSMARGPALAASRGEAPSTGATRRTPVLSATVEGARTFDLRVGEPAAVASVLTSGRAAGPHRTGVLRKAAMVTVAGLALVGAIAIFHSLGMALPL
jgi:hypothetical protein